MAPGPEYHERRPKRGRDIVAPPASDDTPSLSTLQLQLAEIDRQIKARRPPDEDTGVQRVNTRALAAQVEAAVAAHYVAETEGVRRTIKRWAIIIGGVASIIATAAVSIVRAWPSPEAAAVQSTVEQQAERIETVDEQQGKRLDNVEAKLGEVVEAIGSIASKLDDLEVRPPEPEPPRPRRRTRRDVTDAAVSPRPDD